MLFLAGSRCPGFLLGRSGNRRWWGMGPWQEVGAVLLELGNDDLSRPLTSDPLVLASLVVWVSLGESELLAAAQ